METLQKSPQQLIDEIALGPDITTIRKIMDKAKIAEMAVAEAIDKADKNHDPSVKPKSELTPEDKKRISKLNFVEVLAPSSLNPNETILTTLALKPWNKIGESTPDQDGGFLKIIADGNGLFYPLAADAENGQPSNKRSNGPNGVYIPGNSSRMNLFSEKGLSVSPHDLLDRYIKMRDANVDGILDLTIGMIERPKGSADNKYRSEDEDKMAKILSLLKKVKARGIKTKKQLNGIGMDIVSFCQTWDPETGDANFSVMSPHFQNRLFIKDPQSLKSVVAGITDDEINAFNDALQSMNADRDFIKAYGEPGPKFINLDKLKNTLETVGIETNEREDPVSSRTRLSTQPIADRTRSSKRMKYSGGYKSKHGGKTHKKKATMRKKSQKQQRRQPRAQPHKGTKKRTSKKTRKGTKKSRK